MNSILSSLGIDNNALGLMIQAYQAMSSGQRPQEFLMNLAKSQPELQGLDFSNLEKTANEVCAENNVDKQALTSKIKDKFANLK